MVWPLLFVAFFVIYARKSIYNNLVEDLGGGFIDRLFDRLVFILFIGLLLIFPFGLGLGFGSLVGLAVPKHWTGPETVRLVSLRSSDGTSGNFFLGTGSLDTTPHYFFYQEAGRGYQPGSVAVANNVMIFEEKRQDGELKVYTYQFSNRFLPWIALGPRGYKYEFMIPEGSLKRGFVPQ